MHVRLTVVLFVLVSSLDNAAVAVPVALYPQIAGAFEVPESAIGLVTGLMVLIIGVSAFIAGYIGDRGPRKATLIGSTLFWGTGMLFTALSESYVSYLLCQLITAIGLGGVISVGLSTINDFVSPDRRGLALSVWGLSQALGVGAGVLVGAFFGVVQWMTPFYIVGLAGIGSGLLYILAYSPEMGAREYQFVVNHDGKANIRYRISKSDLAPLLSRRSNVWLVLVSLVSQIALGAMVWLPRLFSAKAESSGFSLEHATIIGGTCAILFQVGGVFSVAAGHIGDEWQKKDDRGRSYLSAIGTGGAVPFLIILFLIPIGSIPMDGTESSFQLIVGLAIGFLTDPWFVAALVVGVVAAALMAIDAPNWMALVAEANRPEHRGTVFGYGVLANALGRSIGTITTGYFITLFGRVVGHPWDVAFGLSLVVLFFLPASLGYLMLSRTFHTDRSEVRGLLQLRATRPTLRRRAQDHD